MESTDGDMSSADHVEGHPAKVTDLFYLSRYVFGMRFHERGEAAIKEAGGHRISGSLSIPRRPHHRVPGASSHAAK